MTELPPVAPTAPTPDDIRALLRGVLDPELHASIVDLGMVRDIHVGADGDIEVGIALTIAACPLRSQIEADVVAKLDGTPGVRNVVVRTTAMTPAQRSDLMGRARQVARDNAAPTEVPATCRVIAVASGKGGVGKSTTTANLAFALRDLGHRVGVLDADIWGFSVHRMLGADGRLGATDGKIDPADANGLKVVSMGLLVDNDQTALMWRGLMLTKAVEQFLRDVRWGDLDYLVIDMPPGTGDVQMGLTRMLPQAEMLVVTTPQAVAQSVAVRVADMARRSHMKVFGIVENMSGFTCDHGEHYAIFGTGGGAALANDLGVPLIAQVPLDPASVQGGDDGAPIVSTHPDSPAAAAYRQLARHIVDVALPPIEMAGCTARLDTIFDDLAESLATDDTDTDAVTAADAAPGAE